MFQICLAGQATMGVQVSNQNMQIAKRVKSTTCSNSYVDLWGFLMGFLSLVPWVWVHLLQLHTIINCSPFMPMPGHRDHELTRGDLTAINGIYDSENCSIYAWSIYEKFFIKPHSPLPKYRSQDYNYDVMPVSSNSPRTCTSLRGESSDCENEDFELQDSWVKNFAKGATGHKRQDIIKRYRFFGVVDADLGVVDGDLYMLIA